MSVKPSEGIGSRLAQYRRLAGLSARELAEQAGAGLSRGVIANIESGRKRDLTVDQLIAVCHVLGVQPAALALPIEQPMRFVRMSGQEDGSSHRTALRSWAAAEWFQGYQRFRAGDDDAPNPAGALSQAILNGVRKYVAEYLASDMGRKPSEDLHEAEAALQALGIDLTPFKIDE